MWEELKQIEWRFLILAAILMLLIPFTLVKIDDPADETAAEAPAAGGNLSVHPGQTVYYECNGGHYIISCEE